MWVRPRADARKPGPSVIAQESTPRGKAPGRSVEYQYDIIARIAADIVEVYGFLATKTVFSDEMRKQCTRNGYGCPGDTLLKELLRPLYDRKRIAPEGPGNDDDISK